MMNNRKLLQSVMKRLQQDRIFLEEILSTPMTSTLRETATAQLKERTELEAVAAAVAASRCWAMFELQPGAMLRTKLLIKFRTIELKNDSRIAAALIKHHTNSMILLLQSLHQVSCPDSRVMNLVQCYLDSIASAQQLLRRFL